jgi:hypothetical protein
LKIESSSPNNNLNSNSFSKINVIRTRFIHSSTLAGLTLHNLKLLGVAYVSGAMGAEISIFVYFTIVLGSMKAAHRYVGWRIVKIFLGVLEGGSCQG